MADVTNELGTQAQAAADTSPTLCDLFARTAARTPDAIALSDPPNKSRITGAEPVQLTYAEADAAIVSLSAQFASTGLHAGSIIAVQLPNTIELPLTLLAAWRAGLVVALLPQLWRQADLGEALNRVGARALVTSSRIEIVDHADIAMNAAVEAFSIRHVFGFGKGLPDGMTQLDWTLAPEPQYIPAPPIAARKPVIVSYDLSKDGMVPVPRSHVHLIAGGLAIFMQGGVQGAKILSTMLPTSFAGLASSVVFWLLTGGSLSLHHPFDAAVLEEQIRAGQCDTLVAPAQLALRMSEAQIIDGLPSLKRVIGLWRTPERVASSATWTSPSAIFTDVYLFGEIGLFALNRLTDGMPAPVALGSSKPRDSAGAGELLLTPHGTLGLRGPMVPLAAYRPRPKDDQALLSATPPLSYVDTGFSAKLAGAGGNIDLTAPPSFVCNVGGYRFRTEDLERWSERLVEGTVMMAVPDQLNGFRIAGRSNENARAREALAELGLNPLMVEAFRQREAST